MVSCSDSDEEFKFQSDTRISNFFFIVIGCASIMRSQTENLFQTVHFGYLFLLEYRSLILMHFSIRLEFQIINVDNKLNADAIKRVINEY